MDRFFSFGSLLLCLIPVMVGPGCPEQGQTNEVIEVQADPKSATINDSEDSTTLGVDISGDRLEDQFRYTWVLPVDAAGTIHNASTAAAPGTIVDTQAVVGPEGTDQAVVNYVLTAHSAIKTVKLETLFVTVSRLNADGSVGEQVGTDQVQVTIFPPKCNGADGTPVVSNCGLNATCPSSVQMGDQMTITFTQQSGGPCGGTWTILMNMPGQFVSAPGGTIGTQSASFPDAGVQTTRTAVYQLSANGFDYAGIRTCPRALGYYEPASSDTGPYVSILNGAAGDALPFVVNENFGITSSPAKPLRH